MNLKYYNGRFNFGDQLNHYIFSSIFSSSFFSEHPEVNFYGIGTFLGDKLISEDEKNIIFGTGIRDILRKFDTRNWDIRAVRGKITARCLEVGEEFVISDPAYLLKLLPERSPIKKDYECSIVPYFTHLEKYDWEKLKKDLKVNIIYPTSDCDTVIDEIRRSKKIIAGAMHGAIVADVFRVPWKRIKMGFHEDQPLVSEIKWADWLSSLNMKVNYDEIPMFERSSNNKVKKAAFNYLNEKSLKYYVKGMLFKKDYYLSDDKIFNGILDKFENALIEFSKDYNIEINLNKSRSSDL